MTGPITRISVLSYDYNGYAAYCEVLQTNKIPRIYLNGIECPEVITADTFQGFVDRWKKDAKGIVVIENDDFVLERVWGKVEIIV